jgi:hypothetical protein
LANIEWVLRHLISSALQDLKGRTELTDHYLAISAYEVVTVKMMRSVVMLADPDPARCGHCRKLPRRSLFVLSRIK